MRSLGRPDVARDVIEALMVDRGLRRSFDPAVEREARQAASAEQGEAPRQDLRALPTFTIDPVAARDFDDAISARGEEGGGWRVWVHIADVCAYVGPRSLIDREAYRRGTSVYVPGAVEPMLPDALSGHACSLVPGQDRLTVTAELTIRDGATISSAFYRSVIRSDARLTYDQVDGIFAGRESPDEAWGEALATARAAAAALGPRRTDGQGLVVESSEPQFRFDPDGHVVGFAPEVQTESHRLIEQLMIAANEQVAALLEQRRTPTLFRVHERPDPMAVARLIDQLVSLEVPTPPVPRGHMTSQQAADLVAELSQLLAGWVRRTGRGRNALTSLMLRSLKQARYDNRNLGHAGLGLSRYCHFTSPIRRYPDVICHRGLLSVIEGSEPAPEGAWVASAGPWTSAREREAMAIERDADDVARAFLLERRLFESGRDEIFEGEVTGLIGAGAFVAFGPDGAFEGMLPVRRMRGDWWEINEQGTILIGTRSGSTIRLGDPVAVHVDRVDAPRGRVDLVPASGFGSG
jgi:ribonuclease R